jgi:hypothetical protein
MADSQKESVRSIERTSVLIVSWRLYVVGLGLFVVIFVLPQIPHALHAHRAAVLAWRALVLTDMATLATAAALATHELRKSLIARILYSACAIAIPLGLISISLLMIQGARAVHAAGDHSSRVREWLVRKEEERLRANA